MAMALVGCRYGVVMAAVLTSGSDLKRGHEPHDAYIPCGWSECSEDNS